MYTFIHTFCLFIECFFWGVLGTLFVKVDLTCTFYFSEEVEAPVSTSHFVNGKSQKSQDTKPEHCGLGEWRSASSSGTSREYSSIQFHNVVVQHPITSSHYPLRIQMLWALAEGINVVGSVDSCFWRYVEKWNKNGSSRIDIQFIREDVSSTFYSSSVRICKKQKFIIVCS